VPEDDGNEEWEDASVSGTESDSSDLIEGTNVRYGDSPFELILPSGARIGHRALKSVYTQNLVPYLNGPQGRTSALSRAVEIHERRLARNESSALVPARGAGYGPGGTVSKEVIRAKNKGEAKHAGRNMREFREQRARLNFQTKIGFVHNSQKHVGHLSVFAFGFALIID
jgi:pre-60S factor REI1